VISKAQQSPLRDDLVAAIPNLRAFAISLCGNRDRADDLVQDTLLRGIAKAVALSRSMMRNIRQNLFFAFIYNALGIPLAAGLLYPFLGVLLSPMIAGAAMSLSSVSVIANALRLRHVKL